MRLPDVNKLVETYNSKLEMSLKDIRELFDCSASTAVNLKKKAREQMAKDGRHAIIYGNVETQSAYSAWGIDVTRARRLAR